MRQVRDLDALDAATLRSWRLLNLVGWGVAGAATTIVVALVAGAVTQRLYEEGHSWSNALAFLSVLVAGGIGGALVGAKVYRSPGTVAFLGQAALFAGSLVWQARVDGETMGPIEVVMHSLFWLLVLLPAVLAARLVWRRRPASLRGAPTALARATVAGTPAAPGTASP